MTFLIDGYNLMHAIGLVRRGLSGKGFEHARTHFLDWLAGAAQGRKELIRVVFDARSAPAPSAEYGHRGVRVCFAYGETADDRIEELITAEREPKAVTVVSNDGRVQADARRRGCVVQTCQEFVDWLLADGRPAGTPGSPEPDKPEPAATPEEIAAWLAAFSVPPKRHS